MSEAFETFMAKALRHLREYHGAKIRELDESRTNPPTHIGIVSEDLDLVHSIYYPNCLLDYDVTSHYFNYVLTPSSVLPDPVLVVGLDDDVAEIAGLNPSFIFFQSSEEISRDDIDINRPFVGLTYLDRVVVGNNGAVSGVNPAAFVDKEG